MHRGHLGAPSSESLPMEQASHQLSSSISVHIQHNLLPIRTQIPADPCHTTSRLIGFISTLPKPQLGLLEEIGFGFLARLSVVSRHNRVFSEWIMSRLHSSNGSLSLDLFRDVRVAITPALVAKTLRISNSGSSLLFGNVNSGRNQLQWQQLGLMICNDPFLGLPRVNVQQAWHTLTHLAAADYLSDNQKQEFKSALILFSVSNILAPLFSSNSLMPYVDNTLIEVALHPETAKGINWAAYIYDGILVTARNHIDYLQQPGPVPVQLGGCCLFLQMVVLDAMYPILMPEKAVHSPALRNSDEQTRDQLIEGTLGYGTTAPMEKAYEGDSLDQLISTSDLLHIPTFSESFMVSQAPIVAGLMSLLVEKIVSIYGDDNYRSRAQRFLASKCDRSDVQNGNQEELLPASSQLYDANSLEIAEVLVSLKNSKNVGHIQDETAAEKFQIERGDLEFQMDCSEVHQTTYSERLLYTLENGDAAINSRYSSCGTYASVSCTLIESIKMNVISPKFLERICVASSVPAKFKIYGHELYDQLLVGKELTIELGHAIILLFTEQDNARYKEIPGARMRHFLSPIWARSCMSRDKFPDKSTFKHYFGEPFVEYDVKNCSLFLCPALIGNEWVCYAIELYAKVITIIQMDVGIVPSNELFTQVKVLGRKVAKMLVKCIPGLDDKHLKKGSWSVLTHTFRPMDSYHNAIKNGLCMILLSREFDGDSVRGVWDEDSIEHKCNEVLAGLMYMECNLMGYPVPIELE